MSSGSTSARQKRLKVKTPESRAGVLKEIFLLLNKLFWIISREDFACPKKRTLVHHVKNVTITSDRKAQTSRSWRASLLS